MECSWFRAGKWNLFERSEKIHLVKCNYVKVFPLFSSSVPSCSLSHCSLFSKSSSKGLIKCFSFLRRDWEWICCFEGKVFSICKNILLCFAFHGRKVFRKFQSKVGNFWGTVWDFDIVERDERSRRLRNYFGKLIYWFRKIYHSNILLWVVI